MRSPFQFDAESCCRSFKALSRFPHFDGCLDVFTKLQGDHRIWEGKWKLKQNNSVMRQYTKVIIMEQFDNNYIAWFMTFKTHIQFKQKGYLYSKPKWINASRYWKSMVDIITQILMPHNIKVHVWNKHFYSFLNSFNYANNLL